MHASNDPRLLKCFDGLHFSFKMLTHAYCTLHPTCARIPEDNSSLVPALAQCWSFIDALHRIREIAQAVPGLSSREPQLVLFLQRTDLAETYRHYIQHLRSELAKTMLDPFPVWGSLSWADTADPRVSHTAIVGAQLPGIGYAGAVWDRHEGRWVSSVSLSVAGTSFHFDPIYQAGQGFRAFIIPWLISTYEPGLLVTTSVSIVSTRVQTDEAYSAKAHVSSGHELKSV